MSYGLRSYPRREYDETVTLTLPEILQAIESAASQKVRGATHVSLTRAGFHGKVVEGDLLFVHGCEVVVRVVR